MRTTRSERAATADIELPATKVVRQIENLIAGGSLVAGQRLVEQDLVAQFGATRRAVREALRYLAGAGVVELLPRGARLTRANPRRLGEILEVYDALMRSAMELFAERPIPAEVRSSLDAAAQAIEGSAASGQPLAMLASTATYSREIFECCGNDFLNEVFYRVSSNLHYAEWASRIKLDTMRDITKAYQDVHRHLMNRDAVSAYAVLNKYVREAVSQICASA